MQRLPMGGNRLRLCQLFWCLVLIALNACGGGGNGAGTPPSVSTTSSTETINGIAVPPAPSNPNATFGGTDINLNGVRDDVERALATRVGTSTSAYTKAISTSRQLQLAITNAGVAAAPLLQDYLAQTNCITGAEQLGATAGEEETLNTRERQGAMVNAYVALMDAKLIANEISLLSNNTCS